MVEAKGNSNPVFSCRNCRNPVALRSDIISKKFMAKTGQAYLFAHAMNIVVGPKEDKQLMTGYFSIAPTFCSRCGVEMGWTYLRAYDPRQKYKEGNYILEKAKIMKEY